VDNSGIGVEKYIEIATPFITGIIMLLVGIYAIWTHKLDSKIDKEVDDREKADSKIENNFKDTIKETITIFRQGIKDEIEFRNGVMDKHETHIEKLFDVTGEILSGQKALEGVVTLNMEHQEEICRLKHEDVSDIKQSLKEAVEKQERICGEKHHGIT
jgi:hypothetical protein